MDVVTYQTIKVRFQESICYLTFHRPDANNTINDQLIDECLQVMNQCETASVTVIVLEGLPEVFCFGADFQEIYQEMKSGRKQASSQEPLYDLWLKLQTGPFVTISHVRGKVNAGGLGFVAASDIVIADQTASFSLSELLFGLYPACVLPFLIRRIGYQKAHYMTLMTKPIFVQEAMEWGLVDAYDAQSEVLLRKHLLRLRRLNKKAIARYKQFINSLDDRPRRTKSMALTENQDMFSDPQNQMGIIRYVETGQFPWEKSP
ncbi:MULTISPECIES: enoyl-CoA hydratase/isomerase [Bacillus]|uniref:enoyl-CoA hydratase/isomerase n=1 Tax=Bacillus TaxID=1386 RepID=UPI000D0373EF|nr:MULTISPECIES: enoyl-CoA hydratase/isomerase [Bacillus]MBV7320547.1 enoyl-CoA hydratase/isomerase [Halalkalibacterium halodurans]AZV47654.1 enoyl-CoA hydratase [Bacillus halotolerans]MCP9299799.1 enoyl-CoA hydratase/isomerase [Bacillus halotolerans]MCV0024494.1 enoyl-CoA hydratase/isomerase [Bacillus sp. XT-2]MEC3638616.1 enoyl-CoA hydratase/isomerase [Bacillus halotolerans]